MRDDRFQFAQACRDVRRRRLRHRAGLLARDVEYRLEQRGDALAHVRDGRDDGCAESLAERLYVDEKPAFARNYAVRDGVLVALDTPTLVIHGGAGVEPGDLTPQEEDDARKAMETALRVGYAKLQGGSSSVDAVTAAITVMEDAPQFNAGRGAVFTHDGRNELDTSIMDGSSGMAGAAAGLHRVKNPITLARARFMLIVSPLQLIKLTSTRQDVKLVVSGVGMATPSM